MKKIIMCLCFVFCAILPAAADTMAVQAVTHISTTKPDEIIKVKVIRDCKLDDINLKIGYILEGKMLSVTDPKRLKKDAGFTFFPMNYTDLEGNSTHISKLYVGKFTPKYEVDGAEIAKNAALAVGNHFVKGLSMGFYAVQGAVQNKEGNILSSAVYNVYENSIFSYVEKGGQLDILPSTFFGLKFHECENAPRRGFSEE
ncbi:MAG: hypothetical protein LUB59_03395 [Candidatus Gastranaerophilales bacterium]|nr:hypothetical protein [Candidatus Gastranaerophilales bacterium]